MLKFGLVALLFLGACQGSWRDRAFQGVFQMEQERQDPGWNLLQIIIELDLYITTDLISLANLNESIEFEGK